MPYRAPTEDFQFLFDHVIGYDQIAETELFAEAPADMAQAVLSEAGKMCEEVLAPLNRNGDLTPAKLENGVVRTSPGFDSGYKAIAEGGWIGMAADPEYGGMGLPLTLQTAVNDMMSSACLSLQLCPLMTQGQIEALEHHASDELKSLYLPKLITGEWAGTMNLTEPQAGSDVGALSSKAVENGDGTYSVTGQKIFISWGDNDITENVCHLVLARLPDGVAGTKGISLFLVPKLIPDADGNPGERNSLRVVSLEHKMGLHGSPTAVMSFEGARGWMIGEPHKGMAAMFTMMNNARLGVGVQGYGTGEGAFQQALEYALERKQGRTPLGDAGNGTIVDFADVRRMLTQMKAELFAARAMAMSLAKAIDMGRATGDADWNARAALLTPIVKAYGTETGINVSNMGIQVHGGMGFIEETGAAQYLRDVRVTAIYEGTNGIQAMDLVGRKMMDGGDAAFRLLEEIETQAEGARALFPNMSEAVWSAAEDLRETIEWQVEQTDMQDRFAGAVPFLMGFARVLGAHYHLKAAIAEGGKGPRTELARFHINRLLPEHVAQFAQARAGAAGLYALTPDDLAS
ncbi:acyl-CoA dehydrogenase [Aliiroseovarius crassostreae]|uniref:acyl-CoA dehydrogenase n=1 Tax=Aliiroseovarius TaxID=1658781 RepID=UPI00156907B4|nr:MULTISPECIES: acyl-CoA dehydrogenase [Aliiroseovarius]NRP12974.1 3-methylmercaptopropionyl-CoA dehydrogenase [Aliiroseovarius sp. xm-d-517]NRP29996.1 3-methylmercaptopropionyl-CoA dehydrogenase [Aliiroseovarius sp. xm-m-314]NRP40007.1 3-methylmercaptopropionyl-CoA dehydrogenase [Aliiroseovarius sp. xm-m-339-2]NRP43291.1 3-methylmercaptopropionyl-CoA dehydrogenase [Aliiroseovarius sp. xm-m-378]NRP49564.1 3-methylmercaptopropionyl-CoA dehydrogenase [Aliiroseovarius sp. xm-m-354]